MTMSTNPIPTPAPTSANRLATIRVSVQLLGQMLRTGTGETSIVSGALPDDAVLVNVWNDGRDVHFTFQSVTFPEVPEASPIPERKVTLRNHGAAIDYFAAGFGPAPITSAYRGISQ